MGTTEEGEKLQERERRTGEYHVELLDNFEMRNVGLNPEIKIWSQVYGLEQKKCAVIFKRHNDSQMCHTRL